LNRGDKSAFFPIGELEENKVELSEKLIVPKLEDWERRRIDSELKRAVLLGSIYKKRKEWSLAKLESRSRKLLAVQRWALE